MGDDKPLVPQYLPAVHGRQSVMFLPPWVGLKVPGGQKASDVTPVGKIGIELDEVGGTCSTYKSLF